MEILSFSSGVVFSEQIQRGKQRNKYCRFLRAEVRCRKQEQRTSFLFPFLYSCNEKKKITVASFFYIFFTSNRKTEIDGKIFFLHFPPTCLLFLFYQLFFISLLFVILILLFFLFNNRCHLFFTFSISVFSFLFSVITFQLFLSFCSFCLGSFHFFSFSSAIATKPSHLSSREGT